MAGFGRTEAAFEVEALEVDGWQVEASKVDGPHMEALEVDDDPKMLKFSWRSPNGLRTWNLICLELTDNS
jgi:hypothetical protein